jgi:hypothetical protein
MRLVGAVAHVANASPRTTSNLGCREMGALRASRYATRRLTTPAKLGFWLLALVEKEVAAAWP